MATIDGARAIGLRDHIGSLAADKQADVTRTNPTTLNPSPVLETPVRKILPNLVYAGSGHRSSWCWSQARF